MIFLSLSVNGRTGVAGNSTALAGSPVRQK
jgi:hypothetical protein